MRSPLETFRRSISSVAACGGLLAVLLGATSCALRQGSSPRVSSLITLHASNAVVHGTMLRYEPQTNKNCLGYWTKAEDWADWTFEVPRSGSFEIEVWQGCGKGQGGSDVAVEIAGKRFDFVVEDTGHFQNFAPRRIGRVELAAGKQTLAVKPQRKQAAAVMDIRRVRLWPVNPLPRLTAKANALQAQRVVFLGDSVTYAGEWVEFVEAYLRLQDSNATFDFINLGLPSETVSGLSEPGHAGGQFPRPGLHERLDRVLAKLKPKVIVACYGMNDGIYHPFSEERFAAFKKGVLELRAQAAAFGAKVIHVTPPTFDPVPIKANTLPAGRDEYRQPYEGYDEVLDGYTAWLVSQREEDGQVIDVHGPMNAYLASRRADDTRFRLASDGVHANPLGHWLMAREFLRWSGVPDLALVADSFELATMGASNAPVVLDLVRRKQRVLKDAWLNEIGHKRPGMAKGKPVAEAGREAIELERQLNAAKIPMPGLNSNGLR